MRETQIGVGIEVREEDTCLQGPDAAVRQDARVFDDVPACPASVSRLDGVQPPEYLPSLLLEGLSLFPREVWPRYVQSDTRDPLLDEDLATIDLQPPSVSDCGA